MAASDLWKHQCKNCSAMINDVLFTCTECPEFDLCMQCYVCGAELGSHIRTHPIKMIDLGTFCLFGKKRRVRKRTENKLPMEVDQEGENNENEMAKMSETKEESTPTSSGLQEEYYSGSDDENDPNRSKQKHREIYYELINGQLVKRLKQDPVQESSKEKKVDRMWRAVNELELLEAISRYGFGNWKDVARSLSRTMPGITAKEVSDHYSLHYILADIGDYTWDWKKSPSSIVEVFKVNEDRKYRPAPRDFFDDVPQSVLDGVGFLPKRGDFERDFDNEAEALISNLSIGPEDEDEIDKKFKLAQIDMFQQRLIERYIRKTLVLKYGLVRKFIKENSINADGSIDTESGRSGWGSAKPGERFSSAFSPFLRFSSKEGLQKLYLDLQREYVLKIIIRKLLEYKQRGLTTMSEIREFEESQKSRNRPSTSMDDSQSNSSFSDGPNTDELFDLDEQNLKRILAPFSGESTIEEVIDILFSEHKDDDDADEEDEEREDSDSQLKSVKKFRLLTPEEKSLCAELKLHQASFLDLKNLIIREYEKDSNRDQFVTDPFSASIEPPMLIANLQAILGPNNTYSEIENIVNKVVDLLALNGDITKEIS